MGDSDDDYDRRPRDKFARERDYNPPDRQRRDYNPDRRGYQQRDAGGMGMRRPPPPRRDNMDGVGGPTNKRQRMDFPDTYDPQPKGQGVGAGQESDQASSQAQVMMSFKRFLATQDDSITDEEAIKKYQDYKLEFKRREFHKFFMEHKDEEWFRLKYHPEDSVKRKNEEKENVRRRFELFLELESMGWIAKARLDADNTKQLVMLMDSLVIKLEGGTDEDIALLGEQEGYEDYLEEERRKSEVKTESKSAVEAKIEAVDKDTKLSAAKKKGFDSSPTSDKGADGELLIDTKGGSSDNGMGKDWEETGKREDEGVLSDSDSDKDNDSSVSVKHKKQQLVSPSDDRESQSKEERRFDVRRSEPRRQMLLHKTASIFLRNIAPNITIAEVESLSKRFPGYLRVGLAEPMPERKFYRRGWITFRRDVNIKEICWNLNNIRLRDCDLGAIVNRDLTKRVRTVNGITVHKAVAQNDLRLAAKLVQVCDRRAGLYQKEQQDRASNGHDSAFAAKSHLPDAAPFEFGIESKNPLLSGITDFLIEESSAEEEELLGMGQSVSDEDSKVPLHRDASLLLVLDRIISYLRLVHSVDYYNHGEYFNEDEMPNRCGMLHVRGPAPSANLWGQDEAGSILVHQQFLNDFMKQFGARLQSNLLADNTVTDDEAAKLGKKDPEKEVEAFVTANCVELAKDKWLCPLSGKKFKGPEFVRKHILSKHNDKLEEVRVEVAYFNNYLYDPKRPQVPEMRTPLTNAPAPGPNMDIRPLLVHQQQQQQQQVNVQPMDDNRRDMYHHHYQQPMQQPPPPQGGYNRGGGWQDRGGGYGPRNYNRPYQRDTGYGQNRDYGNMGGRNRQQWNDNMQQQGGPPPTGPPQTGFVPRRRDPREPITYKDLDAPEEIY